LVILFLLAAKEPLNRIYNLGQSKQFGSLFSAPNDFTPPSKTPKGCPIQAPYWWRSTPITPSITFQKDNSITELLNQPGEPQTDNEILPVSQNHVTNPPHTTTSIRHFSAVANPLPYLYQPVYW
jgi:hypothetical protein